MRAQIRGVLKRSLPRGTYRRLVHLTRYPPVGRIDFGDLRVLEPISDVWGLDRGLPVDRYYIEAFLNSNASRIRGNVLEIGDDYYTRRFGGDRVLKSDILHVSLDSSKATIVGDLTKGDHLPHSAFDCIVCTQTLQFIYDVETAVRSCHAMLAPGGVLLATFPGISQISRYDMDRWGDYWRLTSASARRLFAGVFQSQAIEIKNYGNVLAATAFLHGIAVEELRSEELDRHDPDYQVLIAVRAEKPGI